MKNFTHYVLSLTLSLGPTLTLNSAPVQQNPISKTQTQVEKSLEPPIGDDALEQIGAILEEKKNRTPEQRKIESQLLQAMRERQNGEAVRGVPSLKSSVAVDDAGKTLVEIKGEVTDELLDLLRSIDGEVLSASVENKMIRARLPIDLLEAVARRSEIKTIRTPARYTTNKAHVKKQGANPLALANLTGTSNRLSPRLKAENLRLQLAAALGNQAPSPDDPTTNATITTGPPNTQGDAAHRANTVRDVYGVNGTGIKIGVISDSSRYLDRSQANGNLPADVTVLPGQSGIQSDNSDEGEGTAMMEIIYDIVPGAKLFFATGTSPIDGPDGMAQNIRDLRFKYGCDIIVDDIGWSDQLPFQDFTLARAVNDVTANGALYFSAAGNAGNYFDGTSDVWQGDFKDAGRPAIGVQSASYTIHDFGDGVISNRIPVTGGAFIRLFWADPVDNSTNDYDLFVLDSTLTRVKAASVDDQLVTGFPGEGVAANFSAGDRIVIANYNNAKPRALYLDTFGYSYLALVTGGSITGQAAAAEAFAVAAVPASVAGGGAFTGGPKNPVEAFTSDGPRHIFFNANGTPVTPGRFLFANGGTVRNKPDVAAADGVSTSLPQSFFSTFFGTSAAAPHAAAVAALIKSAVPNAKKEDIRQALTSTALDIGPVGWDRVSGAGIVSAFNAYLKIKPSPFLEYNTFQVLPGEGDGDQYIEPGEEGLIKVIVNNNGTARATGVKATITSTTPGVIITSGTSDYWPISDGKAEVNLSPLRFRLSPTATCGLVANFTVTISNDQTLSRSFNFSVQTGQPASTPSTLSVKNAAIAIPDGTTAGTAINLGVSGFTAPITRFAFRFDGTDCSSPTGVGLQHDRVSDLVITLTSPAGTTVTLMSNPGGLGLPSKNFCNTLLDDSATNLIQSITTAGAPYSGAYRPSGRFSSFNGQSANGTWVLRVSDRVTGTTGTLRNFSLLIYTYGCQTASAVGPELTVETK